MRRWIASGTALAALAGGAVAAGALPHAAAAGQAAPVKTTAAHMLVDARGRALYVFAPDQKGKSACYGKCATFWPPLTVAPGAPVPATLPGLRGTFGTARRANGARQLTYDGAPLYRFGGDKKPGDMAGQGLDVAGGYWWLVVVGTAAPSAQTSATAPAAATPTSSAGGYYNPRSGDDQYHHGKGD